MDDELDQLANWVEPILQKMSSAERRTLMKEISRDLRKETQQRMKEQKSPDGSPWPPRKPRLRETGKIRKRAMFTKLRTAKHLKIRTTASSAGLSFAGIAGRIAATHHYGLRDKVDKYGPVYDYPARPMLGFSASDLELIADRVLSHVSDA